MVGNVHQAGEKESQGENVQSVTRIQIEQAEKRIHKTLTQHTTEQLDDFKKALWTTTETYKKRLDKHHANIEQQVISDLDSYPAHAKANLEEWWMDEQPELKNTIKDYMKTVAETSFTTISEEMVDKVTQSADKANKALETQLQTIRDTQTNAIKEMEEKIKASITETNQSNKEERQKMETTKNGALKELKEYMERTTGEHKKAIQDTYAVLTKTAKETIQDHEERIQETIKQATANIEKAAQTARDNTTEQMKSTPAAKTIPMNDTHHLSSESGRILSRINTAKENAITEIQDERDRAIERIKTATSETYAPPLNQPSQSFTYNNSKPSSQQASSPQRTQTYTTTWRQDKDTTLEELQERNEYQRQQDYRQKDMEERSTRAIAGLRYFNKDNLSHWLQGAKPTQANVETFYRSVASSLSRNNIPIVQYQDLKPNASTLPPNANLHPQAITTITQAIYQKISESIPSECKTLQDIHLT
jgi:hypothetical protein